MDVQAQAFSVPDDKDQAFTSRLIEVERQPLNTSREAVQLADKMISMAPAIGTAPIYNRIVAWALVGIVAWEDVVVFPK